MLVTITNLHTYHLVLMVTEADAHATDQEPIKLTSINWLDKDEWWTDAKSFDKLKAHYQLTDSDFKFIHKNSLSIDDPAQAILIEAVLQIKEYAQEQRKDFDLPLDLSIGTVFQQKVWRALQEIKNGEAISYSMLAERIGQPKACRAVANANSKNPFSLIIPCHRVITSERKIGGYTGGVDKKQYLLALEGVKCRT